MKKFSSCLFIMLVLLFTNSKPLLSQTSLFSGNPNQKIQKQNLSFTLPFMEDWSSASFETNGWVVDCSNWKINNQEGNPSPTAEFTWDPQLQNNYSCALTSEVMYASQLNVGQIYLDFDIRLDSRNNTGDEKLKIEVFDGNSWDSITSFSNTSGFEWESYHLDITDQARGTNFQVRFMAIGQNSYDVLSWFVDNISVYRICAAPEELWAVTVINYQTNELNNIVNWDAPSIIFQTKKSVLNNYSDCNLNRNQNTQQYLKIQNDSATLLGFNIYRKIESDPEYTLYDFVPFHGTQNHEYRDTVIYFSYIYCYKVNSIWGAFGDTCTSDFAHSYELPMDNFICTWFNSPGIQNAIMGEIQIYPNPATNQLIISNNNETQIREVVIYNQIGQKVLHSSQISVPIDVSMLSQGMYVVEVACDELKIRKKLIVSK